MRINLIKLASQMNQVESQTNILMGAIRRWHIFFFIRVINEMTTASQPQKIKNWKLKWIHYLRIKNKPIRQIKEANLQALRRFRTKTLKSAKIKNK